MKFLDFGVEILAIFSLHERVSLTSSGLSRMLRSLDLTFDWELGHTRV